MKMITVSGPPSSGKTAVILKSCALKGGRFENQLVTAAGGISLNKKVKGER